MKLSQAGLISNEFRWALGEKERDKVVVATLAAS